MQILPTDLAKERDRITWLIRLRWVAVAGVLAVIVASGPVLGIIADVRPLFVLVGFLAVWNAVLGLVHRRGRAVQSASQQVAVDLFVLGALLVFSGGLRNPFSIFVAVQLVLGAILLPRGKALKLGIMGAGLVVGLAIADFADLLPDVRRISAEAGDLRLWAVSLALLITLVVALYFTIGIMEDLRAQGREALRYHEEAERERANLRDVVRSVGAGLVMLDAELRVEWTNRTAAESLPHLPRGSTFKLDGDWPSLERLRDGETSGREWREEDPQGRTRAYEVSAAPVRDGAGNLVQVILLLVDVTERRAVQEQLQRAEKLAALGRLAAGVAHEIATPLGSVTILSDEARDALPRCDDASVRAEVQEYLDDLRQEVVRISKLVKRLLDLGHPGDDRIEEVDVEQLVGEAVRLISVRGGKTGTAITTSFAGELPPIVINRDRVLQVFLNVLDNAVDATREQGGAIRVSTELRDGGVAVTVEDDGSGITAADLQRVFDPFFTTKDVGEGTGLGLYVSYEIMKNLGGDVRLESQPGEGTRVDLTLPA